MCAAAGLMKSMLAVCRVPLVVASLLASIQLGSPVLLYGRTFTLMRALSLMPSSIGVSNSAVLLMVPPAASFWS